MRTKGAKDKQPRKAPGHSGINNFNSAQAIMATKGDEVAAVMSRMRHRLTRAPKPIFNSPEEMAGEIERFFDDCIESQLFPTKRGMALWMGTSYEMLKQWESGSRGHAYSAVLKKASEYIADVDEQLVLDGIQNPVLFMFRSKNYHGLRDQQELVVQQKDPLGEMVDPKEIAERLSATIDED